MRILIVTLAIVLVDQATKLLVKARFVLHESIPVFGDYVRFTYVENPGMAFGLRFAGPWFFATFSLIASLVLLFYIYRLRHEALAARLPFALILGGAVGNLIDRLAYGRVIDFIDCGLGGSRFPVFNVADSAVSVGMVALILLMIFEKDQQAVDSSTLKSPDPNPADSEERDIWQK